MNRSSFRMGMRIVTYGGKVLIAIGFVILIRLDGPFERMMVSMPRMLEFRLASIFARPRLQVTCILRILNCHAIDRYNALRDNRLINLEHRGPAGDPRAVSQDRVQSI